MTAIVTTRNTQRKGFDPLIRNYFEPVAANVVCKNGGIAVRALTGADAGYVKPAITGLNLVVVGRFDESFDNTAGVNGGLSLDAPIGRTGVNIECGAFYYANSASLDIIAQKDVGNLCWLVDDQTVALTNGAATRSPAGIILGVDSTLGVLVEMGPHISALALAAAAGAGTGLGVQAGTATLATGTVTVSGVTLTSTSRIIVTMKDPGAGAITGFADFDTPAGSRNVGAGTFVISAIDDAKAVITTAVCTVDYLIIG